MRKIYFLLFLALFPFLATQAQQTAAAQETNKAEVKALAKEGTYQLIAKVRGKKEFFEQSRFGEIAAWIEMNRKEEEDILVDISPYTAVRILSKKTIESPNFKPFTYLYLE